GRRFIGCILLATPRTLSAGISTRGAGRANSPAAAPSPPLFGLFVCPVTDCRRGFVRRSCVVRRGNGRYRPGGPPPHTVAFPPAQPPSPARASALIAAATGTPAQSIRQPLDAGLAVLRLLDQPHQLGPAAPAGASTLVRLVEQAQNG